MGLSPRVRGSHGSVKTGPRTERSIPASAGQPSGSGNALQDRKVYPRECGAAFGARLACANALGLSPRVRGSLRRAPCLRQCPGSIPASAGQPPIASLHTSAPTVYPRECGAAFGARLACANALGLSPRVRGSLYVVDALRLIGRSIPASAGQPLASPQHLDWQTVYPRECGAAAVFAVIVNRRIGLSPRVRGSLLLLQRVDVADGSIPASAGQPSYTVTTNLSSKVYPRECGAAQSRLNVTTTLPGLSPRVRASPCRGRHARG